MQQTSTIEPSVLLARLERKFERKMRFQTERQQARRLENILDTLTDRQPKVAAVTKNCL